MTVTSDVTRGTGATFKRVQNKIFKQIFCDKKGHHFYFLLPLPFPELWGAILPFFLPLQLIDNWKIELKAI